MLERLAWTREPSNVAFLAIDSNGNGSIDNGTELFGNYTVPGVKNGFDALRVLNLATNGGVPKGAVDTDDPLVERLLLWFDRNHNGISESDELHPAAEFLSAIGVGYQILGRTDQHGNRFRFRGWVHVRTAHGRNEVRSREENNERTRHVWDVFLKIAP